MFGETLIPERYRRVALGLGQKTLDFAYAYTQLGFVEPSRRMAERIEARIPINEARIGAQYVVIATKLRRELLAKEMLLAKATRPEEELEQEVTRMAKSVAAMKVVGHGKITNAILGAETTPTVPDEVTFETVKIARRVDTQPRLLIPSGWISEIQAVQAEHLIEEVPTRIF
ncbi:MAG: hypothetical protein ACREGB_02705 [Candidatus Saccharimonadales bacterium]